MSKNARTKALERADNACEAMVRTSKGPWFRCWDTGVEVHHMLPRSRGGLLLDAVGETYHLVVLCPMHHMIAHEYGAEAFDGALMIDGYVLPVASRVDGRPIYTGTDRYLRMKYGSGHEQPGETVDDGPADHTPPRPVAGPARRRPVPARGGGLGRGPDDAA